MSAQRFCGRCGAPLTGTATFCGRCGTHVAGTATVLPPSPPAAQPAAPGAPAPPPPAAAVAPSAAHRRLPPLKLLGVAGAGLAVVVGVLAVATHLAAPAPPPTCAQFSCGVPLGAGVRETNDFHSSAFGFDVHYPTDWKVISSSSGEIKLTMHYTFSDGSADDVGTADVTGVAASKSDSQLVSDAATADFPSATYGVLKKLYDVPGARVGFVTGAGTMYDATLSVNGGGNRDEHIVILAAHQGNVAIVVWAQADSDSQYPPPSQIGAAAADADYLLTETVFPR